MSFEEIDSYIERIESRNRQNQVKQEGIVSGVTGGNPDTTNPLFAKLHRLEAIVRNQESQPYFCNSTFTENVLIPVSVFVNCFEDLIKHPEQESADNFTKVYEKYNPLILAYILVGYLEHDSTNPIKLVMKEKKSSDAFDEMANLLLVTIGKLMIVESLAGSLFKREDSFIIGLLHEKGTKIAEDIGKWGDEYEKVFG